jgi:hypothetical protein
VEEEDKKEGIVVSTAYVSASYIYACKGGRKTRRMLPRAALPARVGEVIILLEFRAQRLINRCETWFACARATGSNGRAHIHTYSTYLVHSWSLFSQLKAESTTAFLCFPLLSSSLLCPALLCSAGSCPCPRCMSAEGAVLGMI